MMVAKAIKKVSDSKVALPHPSFTLLLGMLVDPDLDCCLSE